MVLRLRWPGLVPDGDGRGLGEVRVCAHATLMWFSRWTRKRAAFIGADELMRRPEDSQGHQVEWNAALLVVGGRLGGRACRIPSRSAVAAAVWYRTDSGARPYRRGGRLKHLGYQIVSLDYLLFMSILFHDIITIIFL